MLGRTMTVVVATFVAIGALVVLSVAAHGLADWGDAPAPYPTLMDDDGARHEIVLGGVFMGSSVMADFDGSPHPDALGDSGDDGVVIVDPMKSGEFATIDVRARGAGYLNLWIDFNHDGDWEDPGDWVYDDEPLVDGWNTLTFPVPFDAPEGATFARFRYCSQGGTGVTGWRWNGEVEDYKMWIGNQPPVADAGGPYWGMVVGVPVAFDGSGSSDSDGGIVSYEWDFGDGNTGTGANPTHTYAAAGAYTVVLTVTDDDGYTDADSAYCDVYAPINLPPVADANGPYAGLVGDVITLDGSGSSDPDDYIVSWEWDLDGDGGYDDAAGETVLLPLSVLGTFPVGLRVTDSLGGTDTDSALVTVIQNTPPVADANGPYAGLVGDVITLDGSGSWDPDDNIVLYEWDLDGDGVYDWSSPSDGIANHAYPAVGTYTPSLRVTDAYGEADIATAVVTITDVQPSGSISGMKFHDVDGDGQLDPGEEGIAGWQIQLLDASGQLVAETTTDANGDYAFTGLQPGTYTVAEVQVAGWIPTVPSAGVHTIVLAGGQDVTDVDFGNTEGSVPPIPELPTYVLLGTGFLGIIGYLGLRRRRALTAS